jgi:deoxyribodipyrimidine photo-lyase
MTEFPDNLKRDFSSREELIAYLQEQFPQAVERDDHISATQGGRQAALERLEEINPKRYSKTRNHIRGDVTRLSPYLRYGVLSLAEVRDAALEKVNHPQDAEKFINELGWRDYWQRVYAQKGNAIWDDFEDYKTGFPRTRYAEKLPDDIREGTTELVCMDSFSQELRETGYLHNHKRMWLAAYVVHWRQIQWQAGALWFLEHLLDGDPASNNLSWQWVASTFGAKPYYYNRENVERFTDGKYCQKCPLYGKCDFEGSYDEIAEKLFPHGESLGGRNQSYKPKQKK